MTTNSSDGTGSTSQTTLGTVTTGTWNASVIGLTYGGTNANLTASTGGIVYSGASAMAILSGTATAGQLVQSGSSAAPTWTTSTYPATNAVNTLLYASSANVMSALATTARSVLTTDSSGVPTWIALTNGQMVIGSTAGSPAAATITGGVAISTTPASNSFTINNIAQTTLTTSTISTTSSTMTANKCYIANNAGVVTLTLPSSPSHGDEIVVCGLGAGGWLVAQNSGQLIHYGSSVTTTGTGGSLASTNQYDSISLRCIVDTTTWSITASVGIITVV